MLSHCFETTQEEIKKHNEPKSDIESSGYGGKAECCMFSKNSVL